MPQNETHELPLPRTTHSATSQTIKWERGDHQHLGRSDQEILRHPIQHRDPRHVKSPQRRKNLPLKRHSRRHDKSTKDSVLNHHQRTVRSLGRSLRIPTYLPTLKLDQTYPAWRGLRTSPRKTRTPSRSNDAGERGQANAQPPAPCRDDPWNSLLHHRATVQKRHQHPRCVSRLRRHHNGRRRQRRTSSLRRPTRRNPRLLQMEEWKPRTLTLRPKLST